MTADLEPAPFIDASSTHTDETASVKDQPIPDRMDPTLLTDYIIRTVIPKEELRIGYAVTEKIVYGCVQRFGESFGHLVGPLLEKLTEDNLVIPGPFRDTWRLPK